MKRTYSEMKDSGVEWIGEIPSGWEIVPAGKAFSETKDKNTESRYDNPFSFKYGKIVNKKIGHIDEIQKITLQTYTIVKPSTIMVNGLNLNYDFVTQRVAIVNDFGIITSAYLAINPNKKFLFPRFAMYMLKSFDYQQVFHGCGNGIRKTLKFQDFKEIFIILPSISEQTAISDYLDEKCAEIDSIISEAKNCIEEYKQWKSAIIFEAVTNGLDPNAEMKDSGVEWIGEIPKKWEVKKIKYIFYVVSGATPKSDNCDYWNGNIIWITPADYKTLDKYIKSGSRNISKLGLQSCSATLVPSGSIIFSKRAPIGAVAVAEVDLCTNQGCLSCVPRQGAHSIFYYYVMSIATEDFELKGTGTTFKEISATSFNDSLLPFPSFSEQTTIANYLDEKCARIDEVISEKEALISDLELYKKSLIYEVVTGKVKVS